MRRIARHGLVLAVALALGCATSTPAPEPASRPYTHHPVPETASAATRACFEEPDTALYLEALHGKVIHAWHLPSDTRRGQSATIGFTMNESGIPLAPRLQQASTPEFGAAVTRALQDASPFAPPIGGASCLIGMPLVVKFRNMPLP